MTIPAFPSLQTTVDGMNDTMKQYCPGCSTGELDLTVDDLAGGQVASKLVAYLQSNPDTNYVLFNFGDLEIGVPEALKAAGFEDKVKLIGNGAVPSSSRPSSTAGWTPPGSPTRLSTRAGRWSTRRSEWSTAAPCPTATRRRRRLCRRTSSTPPRPRRPLAPSFDYEGPAGYQDQFKKLWLVG